MVLKVSEIDLLMDGLDALSEQNYIKEMQKEAIIFSRELSQKHIDINDLMSDEVINNTMEIESISANKVKENQKIFNEKITLLKAKLIEGKIGKAINDLIEG